MASKYCLGDKTGVGSCVETKQHGDYFECVSVNVHQEKGDRLIDAGSKSSSYLFLGQVNLCGDCLLLDLFLVLPLATPKEASALFLCRILSLKEPVAKVVLVGDLLRRRLVYILSSI